MNDPTTHGPRRHSAGPLLAGLGLALALAWPAAAQQPATNPHGALPSDLDCATCHTARDWHTLRSPLGFDHGRTGFALTGMHARAACAQCHLDLRFDRPAIAPDECASCHVDVHEGRMLQTCTECHNTRSFRDVDGELIHARTQFPLTGAHRQVTCESCHSSDVGGSFTALPTTCVSCHQADFRGAKSVDHVANSYPTDCTECHTTLSWHDSPAFDHAKVSGGFTLVGAHAGLRCASCHQVPGMQPLFNVTSPDNCIGCHQADFDREHSGTAFPTTCLSCHNQNRWGDATFDHNATGFPLVGAHASLSCSRCHGADNLASRPANGNDCVACHQAEYDREHGGSSVPTTCAACHNQSSWGDAEGDHAALSGGFQLVGSHATLACTTCHTVPGYGLLFTKPTGQNNCAACHQSQYDQAHGGTGMPTDCVSCHTNTAWQPSSFDHDAQYFAIYSGAHRGTWNTCQTCHTTPGNLAAFTCLTCHEHNKTDTDSHHGGVNGYVYDSTACYSCHRRGGGD